MTDMVNHPSHYTAGKYEVIDVIRDACRGDQYEGYLRGNVIKYIMRYDKKNGAEDLRKARWYLDELISTIEGKGGDADGYIH